MKANRIITISWVLLAICLNAPCLAQPRLGIPEPGLLLFGSITNTAGGLPFTTNGLTWKIVSGSNLVTMSAKYVVVNGQSFHGVDVPFETRSVGATNFGQTANVFALAASPSTYARSAWLGTNPCAFLNRSQTNFIFSKTDRGKSDRVDLAVSIPSANLDSDGDGMPDWAELIAGTNPHDPNSVLRLSTDVRPSPQGELMIQWSSIPGKSYAVHSSSNLANGFSPRATNIVATGSITVYRDPTATGPGPFFYRIKVNQTTSP